MMDMVRIEGDVPCPTCGVIFAKAARFQWGAVPGWVMDLGSEGGYAAQRGDISPQPELPSMIRAGMGIRIDVIYADRTTSSLWVQPAVAPPWTLRASWNGLGDVEFEGATLFDALTALRHRLEAEGGQLVCAGARRDVYPSAMARSMGSARKAYVMHLGQSADTLVDIFESANPESVGTVEEQLEFREEWEQSLRKKML